MANKKSKQEAPQPSEMRETVLDLELKARYWKAQHDIMYYSLEGSKISGEYEAFLQKEREQEEQQRKMIMDMMEKAKSQSDSELSKD